MTIKWKGNHVFQQLNLPDEKKINFGNGDDVQVYWHSGQLVVYASTDDTVIEVGYSGSAQKSFDVILYGNAAGGADQVKWDAEASRLYTAGAAKSEVAYGRPVAWKGSNYSVVAADTGKVFVTNSATTEVVFTLPLHISGFFATFVNSVYQTMSIQHLSGDCLVVAGDPTADKVSFATASMQVGAACDVACDGSRWLCMPHYWNVNLSSHGSVVSITT